MSTPIEGKPTLQISQSNLQRSDALRASMGLPPLETQVNAKVVSPNPPSTMGNRLAELQGKAGETISPTKPQENEAVSFLKIPFVGQKAQGTSQVPSTTILDPLQFFGFGAATKTAIKGGSALVNILKSESKPVVKEGAKDIGLSIKPSSDYLASQRFERQTRTLPKPDTFGPPTPPKIPKTQPVSSGFTSTNVNLGRGIGTMIPKSGKGGGETSNLFKPPPSSPQPPKTLPSKETSAGKGLIQILKEKPLQQQQKSQFKEYPISLGKSTVKTIQKQQQTTKADQLMKDYMKSLQSLSLKRQTKQKQTQDLVYISQQKTKQRQEFVNPPTQKQRIIPIFSLVPKQTLRQISSPKVSQIQKQSPMLKQPQSLKFSPVLFTSPKTSSKTQNTSPNLINSPNIPREPPTTKKKIGDIFPFSLNPLNAGGGGGFGEGNTKAFVGNVPEYQFTGMFNRIETRYGKGGAIPRGYKVTKTPASNAFTAFSKSSGQTKRSSKQPKSLSNKFTRLI